MILLNPARLVRIWNYLPVLTELDGTNGEMKMWKKILCLALQKELHMLMNNCDCSRATKDTIIARNDLFK